MDKLEMLDFFKHLFWRPNKWTPVWLIWWSSDWGIIVFFDDPFDLCHLPRFIIFFLAIESIIVIFISLLKCLWGREIEWCVQKKALGSLHLLSSNQYWGRAELGLKFVTRGWIWLGVHILPMHWVGLGKSRKKIETRTLSVDGLSLL